MSKGKPERVSRRERLDLMMAAMVPGVLALVGPLAGLAGRLSWLAPLAAVPVGLWLGRCWAGLGRPDLSRGLERAFGLWPGRLLSAGYLIWGLLLLTTSARQYMERLSRNFQEMPRWIILVTALALCLWLSRGEGGAFARGGRILFLFLMVTLGAIFILALPGINWRYLWPPEKGDWRGILPGGILCLGLAGYGVYTLCLPTGEKREAGGENWAAWGGGGIAITLLVTVGAFGPVLAAELEEPFLSLLEGVKVPGVFRRGEAALAAVLVFGELVLFGLLAQGCKNLWRNMVPRQMEGWSSLFVMAAFFGAEAGKIPFPDREILLWGNLAAGILIPALAFFTKRGKRGAERAAIFCDREQGRCADIGAKKKVEKSCEENEKKC